VSYAGTGPDFRRTLRLMDLSDQGGVLRVSLRKFVLIRDVDPRGCDGTGSIASLTSVAPQVRYYSQTMLLLL